MNSTPGPAYLRSLGAELAPGRKFELDTVRALLGTLGHPERGFRSVHIAGTNGKGSTAALIEAAARAAGWRTGLYTSPHLQRMHERVKLDGQEIGDAAFEQAAEQVRQAAEGLLARGAIERPPTFFEGVTATAFVVFAGNQIDLAVAEVGLGGRLDATNVLAPLVAAITPIGLDHEAYLGTTVAAIAGEKAGIVKPGVRAVVSAPQEPDAAVVIAAAAAVAGVRLVQAATGPALPTALRGAHQQVNAAVAASVCAELTAAGFAVPPAAVARGFAAVEWPGRLEKIADHPAIYLDGAHNPLAARALAVFLRELTANGSKPVLIYGSMRDKAVEEISEILFPCTEAVVLTAPRQARALAPEELARICGGLAPRFETAPGLEIALRAAQRLAGGRRPIVITGSLYLVGEARGLARMVPA